MQDVMGINFGENWNPAVFWLVKYLQAQYGVTCVYETETPDLRAACFPPAHKAPAMLKTGEKGYGVFVRIETDLSNGPKITNGSMAPPTVVKSLADPNLPRIIEDWFQDVFEKAKNPSQI
jgi:hypothetical protein